MKILIAFLIAANSMISDQEISNVFSLNDIKIILAESGQTFWRKQGFASRDSLVIKFGKPDSIISEDLVAIGGYVDRYLYGKNEFNFIQGESELKSYFLYNDKFQIMIKNSIKVGVGDDIREFLKIMNIKEPTRDDFISFPYEDGSLQSLVFVFNPDTKKIIRIYDSPLS